VTSFMLFNLERLWEVINAYSVLVGKPKGKRVLGCNVSTSLKEIVCESVDCIQSRVRRSGHCIHGFTLRGQ
jgi:hypothetical protein